MEGNRFTYCHDGVKLSKLDRHLVCQNFLSSFPSTAATALPRELSDHYQVTLISQHINFGPSPFKFFNSWLLVDGIGDIVSQVWIEFQGYGPADSYLAAKLRHLNGAIRKWRNPAHINENAAISKLKLLVENLDTLVESGLLNANELNERNNNFHKILEAEPLAALDLKQKN